MVILEKDKISYKEWKKGKFPKYVYDRHGNHYRVIWKYSKRGKAVFFVSYRLTKTSIREGEIIPTKHAKKG